MVNKQELYVIDVGQAVDTKHPKSLEYLKRDIKVITKFFYKLCKKINVNIGILKEAMLYDYILYEDDVNYDNDVNKFDSEKKDKAGYIHDNNRKDFFPQMMMKNNNDFYKILNKLNINFTWIGNSWGPCTPNTFTKCLFYAKNLQKSNKELKPKSTFTFIFQSYK